MFKTVLLVGASAGIGIVIGDMADAKLETSVEAYKKLGTASRKGVKTGLQAGSAAVSYGLLASVIGR